MDGVWGVILISLAMFVGCLVLGIIPLLLNLSEQKLQLITVLGAGLLCGTALSIIIPEGVELVQESWKESQVRMSGRYSVTATLGLVIHAAADGVALGAAAGSSQVSVQVLVFFAVILHKAPAAFGLVSFLMHAGLERKTIQKHLLVFSAAAPLLAIGTYFILSASNSSSQNRLSATGIGMLFSAGTFLYVATVHVLPEISRRGQQRSSHLHHHTETAGHQQRGLGVMESLTLILGTALPVLLALGLPED
ncbi:zinc transporter ZIP9 isoform X2 [Triplophysa rosa]|uniref:zinc transporter ZIP9 isoform X2 n=1 Tax=Triplophysa rosa TaxID=992332 RepID=UPI002545CC22|nr:zinc transporter ZIP9 isoform X2 [Triplophysa rosa]